MAKPSRHPGLNTTGEPSNLDALDAKAAELVGLAWWQWQPASHTVRWCPRTPALLGIPADAAPSLESLLSSVHPTDADAVYRTLDEAALGGAPAPLSFRVVLDDDRIRHLRLACDTAVGSDADAPGRELTVTGALLDVTQEAERRLKELRTARQDLLEGMSRAVSTDLNKALVTAVARSHLVDHHSGEHGKRVASDVVAALRKISRFVRRTELLAGREPVRPRALDLDDVVHSAIASFRESEQSRIHFFAADAPGRVRVLGDGAALTVGVIELLDNALNATAAGVSDRRRAGRVEVRIERGDGPASSAKIVVDDDGPGIPEAQRARYHSPLEAAKLGQHSALGLSVASSVAQAHRGRLVLEDRPRGGARAALEVPAEELAKTPAEPLGPAAEGSRRAKVLVVDDEPMVVDVVSLTLSMMGHRVVSADGAAAALPLLEDDGPPDLAVIDVHMPGRDGWWLLEELRRQFPGIRVVMASVRPWGEVAKERGAAGFLHKPFAMNSLCDEISRLLN